MFKATLHTERQAAAKGWDIKDVLEAANCPSITYPNGRYPGQTRHIRGKICAVVDPVKGSIVTVYENVRETEPRGDQQDRDAQRYARGYFQRNRRSS